MLCGKTHAAADLKGMARLGIDPEGPVGRRLAEAGWPVWDRLDGLHPPQGRKEPSHHDEWLNAQGCPGPDPWEHWANAAEGPDGEELNGWPMKNNGRPARAKAEHTGTACSAMRARAFIDQAGDAPWCLHLSFIKPNWPCVVPAPCHAMHGAADVPPVVRSEAERTDPHPVLGAVQTHRVSRAFSRQGVREMVIPAYMGLITQIDDEIGRLVDWLAATGRAEDRVIVFTSDHGDYLGDHWLGEKALFHDCSVCIPLIVMDPSPRADATRGMVRDELVEAIDLLPTFVEMAGGIPAGPVPEGRSLMPLLTDPAPRPLRDAVFGEYDHALRRARVVLDRPVPDCRLQMIFDGRWKMIRAEGFRPMLHDLEADPDELHDLGADPARAAVVARLSDRLPSVATRLSARITRSDAETLALSGVEHEAGILIGFRDEADLAEAETSGQSGN